MDANGEKLEMRVYGDDSLPTLVYLPGLHGDWTLIPSFRAAVGDRVRFVEFAYPRSLTWSIDDYANAIESALMGQGVTCGWLLGESFGSQLAWRLLESRFTTDGVILAAGFAKHPWKHGPGLLRWLGGKIPNKAHRAILKVYAAYANFRHRHAPETLAGISEFVSRRTELDRQAMRHRLALLNDFDPNPIARKTHVPVYYLAGLVDPLVPWSSVRRWLRKNCPGYRASRVILRADHNVLSTAPAAAACQVLEWMKLSDVAAETSDRRQSPLPGRARPLYSHPAK